MMVIVAIMILSIYFVCPIIGKIALLLANTVLPDPMPFVDEFIMWVGLFAQLSRLLRMAEFIRTHRSFCIAVATIFLLLVLIFIIILI